MAANRVGVLYSLTVSFDSGLQGSFLVQLLSRLLQPPSRMAMQTSELPG